MALEKHTLIGHIGVLPDGQLQIRQDTVVTDDGVEISRTYHRCVVSPGDDVSAHDATVQTIAKALWTPDVIAARKAAIDKAHADLLASLAKPPVA